jgi:hypothetical protein
LQLDVTCLYDDFDGGILDTVNQSILKNTIINKNQNLSLEYSIEKLSDNNLKSRTDIKLTWEDLRKSQIVPKR